MSMPEISIIVPVYNAENYLRRCVENIVGQTFTDWELLLVDDGSPDASGEICDCMAEQDRRIKVIHKSNSGVAGARETGMRNARGRFSIHVDPDDWIEPDMLETMHRKAVECEADMVVCDFIFDYGPGHQETSSQECADSRLLLRDMLTQKRHGSLCNKLIRTELYRRYDLHFPVEMICWEDMYICCNILLHPCRVEYVGKPFYHYDLHSNQGSMTRMATHRTLDAMKSFCRYFDARLGPERSDLLFDVKAMVAVTAFRCNLLPADEIRNLYPEINSRYISEYRRRYDYPLFCSLAVLLDGKSMAGARRVRSLLELIQRVKALLKKIVK